MSIFGRSSRTRRDPDSTATAAPSGASAAVAARCPELGSIGLDPAADPPPATGDISVCEDCLQLGERHWAHLRICLECGHVGCCDSSPRRHATAHFQDMGHPVMRSAEPGEAWRWCYIHELTA